MAFEIRKAERRKAKLRLGITGPSGSGKTLTALFIAYGLVGDWNKIGLIDTENGRGELYANTTKAGVKVGEYMYGRINPPYSPDKYIEAIKALEDAGAEVVIIDSFSHAWAGEGGILDIQGQMADRGGNSFAAWRKATPLHNKLVDTVIMSNVHQILTMRSKTEYAIEQDGKNTKVRKVGTAPVARDNFEYEMTVVIDMAMNHTAEASKDNTDIFDQKIITPGVEHGKMLREWLETGAPAPTPEQPKQEPVKVTPPVGSHDNAENFITADDAINLFKEMNKREGGWKVVYEACNAHGMSSIEGKSTDEVKNLVIEMLQKFTRNEFDVLSKKVKALPFKSQAKPQGGNA